MKAILALEDGSVFEGKGIGAAGEVSGEVVFNTSMTGYQEILTDPSYAGEIVTMTYPLIGNYGISKEDFESKRPHARGFVVKELCRMPSNWRSVECLEEFLTRYGIIGIEGIDTRALTKLLRSSGTMRGIIANGEGNAAELIEKAKAAPFLSGHDFIHNVSTPKPYEVPGEGKHVAVLDMGCKENIVRCLSDGGCRVSVMPCDSTAADILETGACGLIVSNGPGDPKDVPYAIRTVKNLKSTMPIFGICLGHQIIGLALGGDTYKLKFGHRGANHPVKDFINGHVYITSQNHGFAVSEESLKDKDIIVSHRNLNDGTIEGLAHKSLPIFSVQYHPEASPGPQDSRYLFERFYNMLP